MIHDDTRKNQQNADRTAIRFVNKTFSSVDVENKNDYVHNDKTQRHTYTMEHSMEAKLISYLDPDVVSCHTVGHRRTTTMRYVARCTTFSTVQENNIFSCLQPLKLIRITIAEVKKKLQINTAIHVPVIKY